MHTHTHTHTPCDTGRQTHTAHSAQHTAHTWYDRPQVKTRVETVSDRGVTTVKEQLADGMPLMILYGHKNWVRLASSR